MITSSPGSRTLSWESVTTTATSMSLSLARSSPVISQSIQTRLLVALSATPADPTHRRPAAPVPPVAGPDLPRSRVRGPSATRPERPMCAARPSGEPGTDRCMTYGRAGPLQRRRRPTPQGGDLVTALAPAVRPWRLRADPHADAVADGCRACVLRRARELGH